MEQNALLSIGPFVFYATAPSFEMIRNTLEPRWAEQERIGRPQASQFIGAGAATVDINGVLYPGSILDVDGSSRDLLDRMAASANAGEIHEVIGMAPGDLSGYSAGRWYIRSIQNERQWFDLNGAKKITFQVAIRAYGEDDQSFGGRLFQ